MDDFFKRLQIFLSTVGINNSEFAEIVNKSISYISTTKKKNSAMGIDVMQLLSEHYNDLDLNWLIMGTGNMLKGVSNEDLGYKTKYYDTIEKLNNCYEENNELKKINYNKKGKVDKIV